MSESGIRAAARRALGVPSARIEEVTRQPMQYDAFMAGRTITRLHGTAQTDGGPRTWSMVEKWTDGPATASPYLYDNAQREYLAYESGLLERLASGVRAPVAHGLEQHADGSLVVWLEDLGPARRGAGAPEVLAAARDLGRLAGTWIGRVPQFPWLFTGWIARHSQPESIERDIARLLGVRAPESILERVGWGIEAAVELAQRQGEVRKVLEALPETLCHHDTVGANVFTAAGAGQGEDLVLIDWEMVGPGPVGADLVSLVFSSARRGDIEAGSVPGLVEPALAAYADGIRDAGTGVEDAVLARSFHAGVALRWALARDVMLALDAGTEVRRGSAPEESPAQAMEQLILLTDVLFTSAAAVGFVSAPD